MDKNIVVFAGNHCLKEKEKDYFDLAYNTGRLLAESGYVVISGAGEGLMNKVLQGALEAGGGTLGVGLNIKGRQQSAYAGEFQLFDKLRQRQERMIDLGAGYLALPGGAGTLHEILDIIALKRVGEMPENRPLVLLGEYYQDFARTFGKMVSEGFLSASVNGLYTLAKNPEEAVKFLKESV